MVVARRVVVPLRVLLVLLFGVLVVFQTLSIPGQYMSMSDSPPSRAVGNVVLLVIGEFWVLCVEVVIVSVLRLLSLVRADRIFTDAALVWVNAITAAIGAAWLVLVAALVWVGLHADDPGMPMVLFAATLGVTVIGLVVLVLRTLLRQATALRTDLDAVI
jgi:hypothetical protein